MAGKAGFRRDSKHRVLRRGESIRADGKYQFKYHIAGKPHFVYSWRLEPTDPLPVGKKPCLSLRELEKQIGYDLDNQLDPLGKNITVMELVERYLKTKVGMRPNTLANYNFVKNILKNEEFGQQKISKIKTSDAKLFLIKMQQEDGRGHSTVKTVRGVLRPAFQMAVDDDVLMKNPFQFELAGVVVNDAVTRQAITKDQMRKFLRFVHDDILYCKYYEVVYILFHTGMRISDADGKISLNQQKPSKHAGLRRFGPEKFLQRNNEFMKERPIFYKKPIKTEKDFSTWLRCFYYTTKAVITEYTYF